jgi:menaquinone-dependent protoporphyrinogen oxidase
MLRLLVVYGTTEGQTRKIADRMAEIARQAGHEVTETDTASLPPDFSMEPYDAVLIGASVHEGRHQRSVVELVQKFAPTLQRRPSAFFSVSLTAALDDEEHRKETRACVASFLEETGWRPAMTSAVAGALLYTRYSFLKRMAMKLIAERQGHPTDTSRDYEYTDWDAVRRFVTDFLQWADTRLRTEPLPVGSGGTGG